MLEPAKAMRILLVEDHLLTRIGLRTVVERVPEFQIIAEADNGEEALLKVDELKPDLVLMDIGLPNMDGIEATRRIRERHEDVDIVMLTSHDSEEDVRASLSAGADGYCLKDVEPQRLYTAIRAVGAGDVWLDSSVAKKVLPQKRSQNGSPEASETEASAPPASKSFEPTSSHKGVDTAAKLAAEYSSSHSQTYSMGLLEPLSPREREVLSLLVEGMSNQEIADTLIVSLATAKTHVRNILNKLAVDDRTQAAVHAMRRGLV